MNTVPAPTPDPLATLDTVGIAVPCDGFDRLAFNESIDRSKGAGQETYTFTRRLPGGGFVSTGIGNMAWIEASLPKRQNPEDPDNSIAVAVDTGIEIIAGMLDEARQWVDVPREHQFSESRLIRLDLVRDFHGVTAQTDLLDGLAVIDQPGRAKVRRFADPSANRAETLRVGPRAWGCTLYDKHVETRGRAPEGQVRFEARLHRPQLSSVFARNHGGHFTTVADLQRSEGMSVIRHGVLIKVDGNDGGRSLARAQRAWFSRVGFDRPVRFGKSLRDRIEDTGLSPRQAGNLWAYLTWPGFAESLSINTHNKYRNLATDFGLVPSWESGEALDTSEGQTIRLDYETGTFVSEAA
jgi:hypothetical protein